MSSLFKNNATALLAASISTSGTTLVLAAGTGIKFPVLTGSDFFYGTIYDSAGNYEIVKVTARSADSLTVVRAQEGTLALAFSSGDAFAQRVTAASLNDFAQKSADQTITGNNTFSGNSTFSGNAAFSGSFSAASPSFTGTPVAPTASPGTSTTQIATTAFVAENAVLTGALLMWPTGTPPAGYLLCAGAAVSRVTYAALFAVIGTTFGAGDGSTTFNLPNYADRMPIGSGTIAATIGATGGSKDAIVVSHSHTASSSSSVSDPSHTHYSYGTGAFNGGGGGGALGRPGTGNGPDVVQNAYTGISVSTSTTVNSTGSSGVNANLPPYLGINFIIKT